MLPEEVSELLPLFGLQAGVPEEFDDGEEFPEGLDVADEIVLDFDAVDLAIDVYYFLVSRWIPCRCYLRSQWHWRGRN